MIRTIPTAIGVLSLSMIGTGCSSDAKKIANTLEKICKDQCDCPEALTQWNDISNCKLACGGYAQAYEAYLADSHVEAEPACAELDDILADIEACEIGVCGYDYNSGCDYSAYYRLADCWPADENYTNPYYNPYGPSGYGDGSELNETQRLEMLRQLMHPIPVATIDGETLHAAK